MQQAGHARTHDDLRGCWGFGCGESPTGRRRPRSLRVGVSAVGWCDDAFNLAAVQSRSRAMARWRRPARRRPYHLLRRWRASWHEWCTVHRSRRSLVCLTRRDDFRPCGWLGSDEGHEEAGPGAPALGANGGGCQASGACSSASSCCTTFATVARCAPDRPRETRQAASRAL